jgi:hypothetical protein
MGGFEYLEKITPPKKPKELKEPAYLEEESWLVEEKIPKVRKQDLKTTAEVKKQLQLLKDAEKRLGQKGSELKQKQKQAQIWKVRLNKQEQQVKEKLHNELKQKQKQAEIWKARLDKQEQQVKEKLHKMTVMEREIKEKRAEVQTYEPQLAELHQQQDRLLEKEREIQHRQEDVHETEGRLGNMRYGNSDIVVIEADEYREKFLMLRPHTALITNLDHDHVDAFPTQESYREAFQRFVQRIQGGGQLILCAQDARLLPFRSHVPAGVTVRTYTCAADPSAADVVASLPVIRDGMQHFMVSVDGTPWATIELPVPGIHVALNATGAIAACLPYGLTPAVAVHALRAFRGVWRRFENIGPLNGATVISDYAHHPTELRALLAAARQWYPNRRLVLAFQVHQPARARVFADAFLDVLAQFDRVLLPDVYGVTGRDEDTSVSMCAWVEKLRAQGKDAHYVGPLSELPKVLPRHVEATDVVFVVGAGDIDGITRTMITPRP